MSGHVDELLANEKNYVHRARVDPGGNGINAGRIASRLGAPVTLGGFLGGPAGQRIAQMLINERRPGAKLTLAFTEILGSTRTNVTVTNDSDHQQTRLTFPGPRIQATEVRAALKRLDSVPPGSLLILGGSLPQGFEGAAVSRLIARAAARGIGLIIDVPAVSLVPMLAARGSGAPRFLLTKPNRVELEATTQRKLESRAEIREAAARLSARCALVCVSLGKEGALLVAGKRAWRADPVRVRAKGSVGAGDSMVGAMATRLLKHGITRPEQIDQAPSRWLDERIRDALAWGVAAGAATAETEGTSLAPAKRIRELARGARVVPLTD
jgi:1-phosphofructokinase family hexose kinase